MKIVFKKCLTIPSVPYGEYLYINCYTDEFGYDLIFNVGYEHADYYYIEENKEYNIDLKLICDYEKEDDVVLYDSVNQFEKDNESFNCESILPIGTFVHNNQAILNCKIKEVLDNKKYDAPDNIQLLYGEISGVSLDIMIRFKNKEQKEKYNFKEGKILQLNSIIEIWPESEKEINTQLMISDEL